MKITTQHLLPALAAASLISMSAVAAVDLMTMAPKGRKVPRVVLDDQPIVSVVQVHPVAP